MDLHVRLLIVSTILAASVVKVWSCKTPGAEVSGARAVAVAVFEAYSHSSDSEKDSKQPQGRVNREQIRCRRHPQAQLIMGDPVCYTLFDTLTTQ